MIRYFEVDFENEFSMCIKGNRRPAKKDATLFLKNDIESLHLGKIIKITEIDYDYAHNGYEMEEEDRYPVFS